MMERRKIRLYSYVVKNDLGLAPNPFWGYCTLAVCTPNHMGARPQPRDWFMGTEPIGRGSKLIYAMQVSEIFSFDDYYRDPRFEKKKPVIKGIWQQSCGDNMYYRDSIGQWKQHPTLHHSEPDRIAQDLKNPYVFIGEHFYYFGDRAVEIPSEYANLIWRRQGYKREHDPDLVNHFLSWLQHNFKPGEHGKPFHRRREPGTPVKLIFS
jgi:hypothetical protein